jgi:hypothetical protein
MNNKLIKLMFDRHKETGKSEWPINWYLNGVSKHFRANGKTSWDAMRTFLMENLNYHPPGLEKDYTWNTLKERVVRYRKLCKIENKPTTVLMSRPLDLVPSDLTPTDSAQNHLKEQTVT